MPLLGEKEGFWPYFSSSPLCQKGPPPPFKHHISGITNPLFRRESIVSVESPRFLSPSPSLFQGGKCGALVTVRIVLPFWKLKGGRFCLCVPFSAQAGRQ